MLRLQQDEVRKHVRQPLQRPPQLWRLWSYLWYWLLRDLPQRAVPVLQFQPDKVRKQLLQSQQ